MNPGYLNNRKIEIFLTKYRDNIKDIHYKLFNIPGINKKSSYYTILSALTPWWLILLILEIIKIKTKKNLKIGIFKHHHLKPFYFLKNIKNNYLLSNFLNISIKLTAYKVLTSFIYSKIYLKTIQEIGIYLSENFECIMLPHDTYPETFFITQLLREYKKTSSICIQHGTAERIFRYPESNSEAIWDGMNSDIFISCENESSKYMEILLNTKSFIKRNKTLKIINLNCFRKWHQEGIIEINKFIKLKKNKTFPGSNNLSIIFLQVGNPNSINSKIYDEIYIKLIPYLRDFYRPIFKEINFIYKARNKKSVSKIIKKESEIKIIFSKKIIFSLGPNTIVLSGISTLAFELREAGFYVLGIRKENEFKEVFPSYIFNKVISMNDLINEKSDITKKDIYPSKDFLKKYKPNRILTCFENENCPNEKRITKLILETHKSIH